MKFGKTLDWSLSISMCMQNLSKYSKRFKKLCQFYFIRIWTSVKLRPMATGIWQSLGLDFVNINHYAKFNQKIPTRFKSLCYTRKYDVSCPNLCNTWKYGVLSQNDVTYENVICLNLCYIRKCVMSKHMLHTNMRCVLSELMLRTKM